MLFGFLHKRASWTKTLSQPLLWVIVLSVVVAIGLRTWHLANIPAGMHQDEAWFAYNAFLLKTAGTNIYGERWPLSVDMWGDYVTSFHSFAIVPFYTLFGVNYFAARLTFATAALLCLGLSAWLVYRITGKLSVAAISTWLFATSQWNIIMTRASSTVVLDSVAILLFSVVFYEGLRWWAGIKQLSRTQYLKLVTWFGLSYGLTVFAYFTYFTSRLVLPIFLVALVAFSWWMHKLSWRRSMVALLLLIAYLVFPFAIMLQTPYALGRYKETTIVNSQLVQNQTFNDITRSGQSRVPIWLTRVLYNKVTENGTAILRQYISFFSPSVVLYQSNFPIRYWVPQAGVVNWVEYLGLVFVITALVLVPVKSKTDATLKAGSVVFLAMVASAVIPTALTIDDFPNFQRGVFVTPFWQMAAAVGWFLVWQTVAEQAKVWPKWLRQQLPLLMGIVVGGGVLLTLLPFMVTYFGHGPYANSHNRSRAGEEFGKWLNANAHDAVWLIDEDEANFLYPYLYAQENILTQNIIKPEKHFLKAPQFSIGSRHYFRHLCQRDDFQSLLATIEPDYVAVKTYPPYDKCLLPDHYEFVHSARFDDGTVGYEIYRFNPELFKAREYSKTNLTPTPTN